MLLGTDSEIASPPRSIQAQLKRTQHHKWLCQWTNPIVVKLLDAYNQSVTSTAQPIVAIATAQSGDTQLSSSLGTFEAGLATFSQLLVVDTPDTTQTLSISTTAADLYPASSSRVVTLHLRACVSGEFEEESACTACAPGEYSFYPDESCSSCPDHASCARGRRFRRK